MYDFLHPVFMGVQNLHHNSSPPRSPLRVHEPNLKYCCGIPGFLKISNWHISDTAYDSSFPLLKITESCRYCIKHLITQCEANLKQKK